MESIVCIVPIFTGITFVIRACTHLKRNTWNRCSAKPGMDIAIKDRFVHLFVLQKSLIPPFLFSHPVYITGSRKVIPVKIGTIQTIDSMSRLPT